MHSNDAGFVNGKGYNMTFSDIPYKKTIHAHISVLFLDPFQLWEYAPTCAVDDRVAAVGCFGRTIMIARMQRLMAAIVDRFTLVARVFPWFFPFLSTRTAWYDTHSQDRYALKGGVEISLCCVVGVASGSTSTSQFGGCFFGCYHWRATGASTGCAWFGRIGEVCHPRCISCCRFWIIVDYIFNAI